MLIMKLKELQAYLRVVSIDLVFLIHPDPNIIYFSQMQPSYALLLISSKKVDFFLTKLDLKPKISGVNVQEISPDWDKKLKNSEIKKVGINKNSLTLADLDRLKKIYPNAKFVDVSSKLSKLRSCKTGLEISRIKKACQITSKAFDLVVKELGKNTLKTEQDVADFLEKSIKSQGGSLAFPTITAMGENSAIPHHKTSKYKLKRGFLLIDFGASYNNYCADMTRVVFIGKPNAAEKRYYALLLETQKSIIDKAAKDLKFKQLDEYARKSLGEYSSKFIHSLGHGIGIEVHEAPVFSDAKQTIKDNCVFTIEPGIYFSGRFGLRIEDTLFFKDRPKILTTATKKLIEIRNKP